MSPAPSDRSHLSIGEVLSLLQDEFPDVTISKIRFLESQGLLDPERTPSGYRKFYEDDIERLRWILRQQKEHYLPLKVIKDRLNDLDTPADEPAAPAGGARAGRVTRRAEAAAGSPAAGERRASPLATDAAGAGSPTNGHALRVVVDGPPAGAGPAGSVTPTSGPDPAAGAAGAEPDRAGSGGSAGSAGRPAARPGAGPPATPTGGAGPPVSGAERAGRVTNGVPTGSLAGDPLTPPARPFGDPLGGVPAGGGAASDNPGSVSLTIDELAEASGMTARDLRDLERFGLLEGHTVGDDTYYDGDALLIARAAGGFLHHGIEARHLRSYKVAVDREAGLFEQLILPLLKQRNPDARRLAGRTIAELVHLGEVMRNVLLRRELRGHLDP